MTTNRITYVFLILITTLWVGKGDAFAQTNLVSNGGFEIAAGCPRSAWDTLSINSFTVQWKSANVNSPRYFNSCASSASGLSTPHNFAGTQPARTGNAYAGLSVFTNPTTYNATSGKLRQYLQTRLNAPLKSGRKYYFEMYVSKADSSTMGYAVNNIGAYLSETAPERPDSFEFSVTPQIISSSFLSDRLNWVKISGSFIASGGEQFITIGRFGNDEASNVINVNGIPTKEAYYYIDDISLIDSCSALDAISNQLLGPDSSFCLYAPFSKTINVTNPFTTHYLWDNGSIFPIRTLSDTGRFWIQLTNGNCQARDTLFIKSNQKPEIKLGNDTAICFNTPVYLSSSKHKSYYTYEWYIRSLGTNFLVSTTSGYTINSPDSIIAVVKDANCSNSDTILVRKSNLKRVNLPADTSFCRQNSLLLNVSSTGPANYLWNTGVRTPSIPTSNLNQYWVTASDGLCTSSDTLNIVYKGAQAPVHDTSICETETLLLKADPTAGAYLWSTGENSASIYALFDGSYRVEQTKDGCITQDTTYVTINKVPVISLGKDTNVCVSPYYVLNATSPYGTQYIWNTGDTTPTLQVSKTGNYLVKVSNQSCSFSDTILLRIQINTPFSFGPDRYDCFETGIVLSSSISKVDSFEWSTLSRDSFIMIKQPGKYWLRTSSGYCTNYDTIELFALPRPSVHLGNDTFVCKNQTITGNAQNPGCRYVWNTGDTTQSILFEQAQSYWVVVTNQDGCRTSDTITLQYHPITSILDNQQISICTGDSVNIIPSTTVTQLQWFDGETGSSYTASQTGWVSVLAIDSLGCSAKDSVLVTTHPLPDIELSAQQLACDLPFEITLANPQLTCIWQDSITASSFAATSFGQYKLKVTDTLGCKNTLTIEVVNNCPSDVTVPNVFTPDQDGKNDFIKPDYTNIKESSWQIFNRWGQLIFSTTNTNEDWNGTVNGKEAEAGVYYYTLVCKGSRDEEIKRTGTITLIR